MDDNEPIGLKLRHPEVIDFVMKEYTVNKRTPKEICDLLLNEFDIKTTASTLKTTIDLESSRMLYDSADRSFADRDKVLKDLLDRKVHNVEAIVNQLEEMGKLVEMVKVKMEAWDGKLEEQLNNYYESHKDEGLDLEAIGQIKDSIHKDINMLTGLISIVGKQWDMYSTLYKMGTPDIKVDKLDMTVKISNEIKNIEKLGYFMIKLNDDKFKDILVTAEKNNQIRLLKNNIYES